MEQRQRPVAALLCEPDPYTGWTKMDYLLQDACLTMNHENCSICHNPIWLCHSTDIRIDFDVSVRACYAKAEIEDYENSAKGKRLGSGEYLVAIPKGLEDENGVEEPLPSRHEAYKKVPSE